MYTQARLYWRVLRDNLDRDSYFKDFTLEPYRFIVVNRRTLTPLVWKFENTTAVGTLIFNNKKGEKVIFRDPCDIGEELNHYLKTTPKVPDGISTDKDNRIENWLK